jgi:hypothetical protein
VAREEREEAELRARQVAQEAELRRKLEEEE